MYASSGHTQSHSWVVSSGIIFVFWSSTPLHITNHISMRSMFKAWYMRSLVIPTMTRIRFLILIMGMNTLIDGGMNLPELMGKYPTVDSGSMSNDTPFNPHYFPIYPQCHHLWIVSPFSKGQHYHIYTIPSPVHTSSWDGIILKQRNLVR